MCLKNREISKEYKGMKCVGGLCVHEHMRERERERKNVPDHIGSAVVYLVNYFGFILNIMEPLGNFELNSVMI